MSDIHDQLEDLCFSINDSAYGHLSEITKLGIADIPSTIQLEGYTLMRDLLVHVNSLAASLRYDVGSTHEKCPEHDTNMRDKINRIRVDLSRMGW